MTLGTATPAQHDPATVQQPVQPHEPASAGRRLRTLRRVLPILTVHRPAFLATLASNLLNQVSAVLAAVTVAWVVGHTLTGHDVPAAAVIVLVACVVGFTVGTWWEMVVAHDLAYRVLAELRVRLYTAIARLAPGRLGQRRSGDLATAAMSDIETLEWLYAHTIAQVLTAAVVLTLGVVGLAVIDPWLLVVVLPLSALMLAVPWLLKRVADRHGSAVREATGTLTADVVDLVQGLRELTLAGALDRRRDALAARTAELARAQRRNASRGGLETALIDALLALASALSLLVVYTAVRDHHLSQALAPVAVVLAGSSLLPASQVAQLFKEGGALRAATERVWSLLEAPAAVHPPAHPADPPTRPAAVEFDAVSFGYPPERHLVLDQVSFRIEPGETVALVGPSGAGKSTCANLLLRYWDPDQGTIRVGGVDLRALRDDDLRRTVSVVSQDVHLFAGTIADNIRLGAPRASEQQLRAAATACQIHDFADQLPDGLDTVIGERGVALSGGQRARVAVARALLTDAPVLILDEAVANLDSASEEELSDALETLRRGRTTLVIAHRLSTIRRADRVVLLENGRVTQAGPLAILATTPGPLRDLLAPQLATTEPRQRHPGPTRRARE